MLKCLLTEDVLLKIENTYRGSEMKIVTLVNLNPPDTHTRSMEASEGCGAEAEAAEPMRQSSATDDVRALFATCRI